MTTPDDQARRAELVRQACHSTALEGGQVTEQTRADLDAYAAGTVTGDQVLERIRDRYGLTGTE